MSRLRRKSRFFVLLWEIRQQLLSAELEAELRALYADRPRGRPPVAPGRLLLATLLQAYFVC